MTLVLVRSVKHAKLISLGAECDDKFIQWHESVEKLEEKWDEMVGFEVEGRLDDSRQAAVESNSLHAKAVEQWFTYVRARQKFVVYEESLSGGYDTSRISSQI